MWTLCVFENIQLFLVAHFWTKVVYKELGVYEISDYIIIASKVAVAYTRLSRFENNVSI